MYIFPTKVKSSSKLHVAKIEELEGKLSRQVEMLGEVADMVRKNNAHNKIVIKCNLGACAG